MNNRLEQLSIAYKKALGAVLLKEFSHHADLTVVDVLLDPSIKTGRVWLATTPEILHEVEDRRGDIQSQLTKYVITRYTPKFSFLLDDNYLGKIDNLFTEIEK
ncbi:MAG: hypothetical protein AAB774_02135 [Patescibacteria group bacterium]